ncbi:hypothetical protein QYH69_24745 [Paraburkholderia sp. SARCC-3016]|nr:hypothetical protein [Paraburkholderia sp. SARCC-3016]MDQ7980450.1 hypothetical protein [Paraburkholderia sp. SARCC-3016]
MARRVKPFDERLKRRAKTRSISPEKQNATEMIRGVLTIRLLCGRTVRLARTVAFRRPFATAYWLAPEAGAAAEASEAAAPASEAAVEAEAAASLAAAAAPEAAAAESEAAAPASEAAAAGADAAAESLAGAAAWSPLLLHAASAIAANRDATRRDFFMITSFYG